MHANLKYVESLEKEIDELESDKAEFSDMYDVILQEYVSNDVKCSYLMSLSDLDALDELQCLYLHKVKECDCLAQRLSKQTKIVSKKVHNELLQRFAKVEKHSISLEITLQKVKNRKSTCFVIDLQGTDLLTGNRGSDLYTISLQESTSTTPLCLMAKASPTQAWLWHRRLSHLNFDYINMLLKKDIMISLPKLKYVKDQLYLSCELSKAKRSSFKSKAIPNDYSRYTWTLFLRSKDETPEVLKEFLMMIQRNLQASVITIRIDRGTEFLNKTLNAFFKEEGIEHQTLTARTPEQNGVVKRWNSTLVEAARTMLSASKLPLFFWAEAIATACYTKN
nr:hypothetical protein [Tanacetum cinerariifolium]